MPGRNCPRALATRLICALGVVAVFQSARPSDAEVFDSNNVTLYQNIDLATLGSSSGNDCWGYVSPSGREYAIMGSSNKVTFVEITNPNAPVIVGAVAHPTGSWSNQKIYGHHCYVVNENSGGIQVIDMSQIDNGTVTLVNTIASPPASHTMAIDTVSGYLYTLGSNTAAGALINGGSPIAFNLSNPANPVQVGMFNGPNSDYIHDAQVITYTSGPYAGQQILFGFSANRGVDIINVTQKNNMFLISRTPYPGVAYCHGGWTEDLQHLYVDDELDEVNGLTPTVRTMVFDVTNLSAPVLLNTFTNGLNVTDHNLYVRDGYIYEANYRSGLRIYCAEDPVHPVEVGYFDTWPGTDAPGFDGAWSVFPFFPSSTVIVSDIDRGLFILDVSAALNETTLGVLTFTFPIGQPSFIDPAGGTTIRVRVTGACGSVPVPSTTTLRYDAGAGFVPVAMQQIGPDLYEASLPAFDCFEEISYYISAEDDTGDLFTIPPDAPVKTFDVLVATGTSTLMSDNFEGDLGWTSVNAGASAGNWERGVPVNDPLWDYDPFSDSDGSGQCFLTMNQIGNTDVDNGAVRLFSPILNLAGDHLAISYDYFLRMTVPAGTDALTVEISTNGGAGPWVQIAQHLTDGGLTWRHHEITQANLDAAGVVPSANTQLRFTANDANPQSIVEAGIDAFEVLAVLCEAPCLPADGDMDGSGQTAGTDVQPFVNALLGTPSATEVCHGDFSGNGSLGSEDVSGMVASLLGP